MTKIVNEESFTIGRSVDCAISLTEDSISRVHLTVHHRQSQIWVEDKGSSNGTFLNEIKIVPNSLVSVVPNDKIRLGKSDYVVSITLELKEQDEPERIQANPQDVLSAPLVSEKIVERKIEKSQVEIQLQKIAEEQNIENKPLAKQAPKVEKASAILEKKIADVFAPKSSAAKAPASQHHTQSRPIGAGELSSGIHNKDGISQFEGEKVLHEAHKRAAQIIYDGEIQAEKRVQAIYVQARERQADADVYYQKKIAAAHKEADDVIMTFQEQGQELISKARHMAQELRDEVELYVENMREKTRREVDHIIADARQEAESVKREAFEKAITKAEIEASDIVASAKAEAQDIVGFAKLQSDELVERARVETELELKGLHEQIEAKQKNIQVLKKEEEELEIRTLGEKEEHEARIADLLTKFQELNEELQAAQKSLASVRVQESNVYSEVKNHEQQCEVLKTQNLRLQDERVSLEGKIKELQAQVGHFTLDIQAAEEKRKHIEADLSQQRAQLKDRLERERQQILKESENRLNESQLEMGKRLQALERELFDEIVSRKDKLVKEILVIVETRIIKVLEPSKWDQVSSQVFDGIQAAIEGKAVSFTDPATGAPKQSMSLQRKKRRDNIRWMTTGLACGLALAFGGAKTYSTMMQDNNPMRTIAAEETRKRQEDLERRKFAPVQVTEVKDNYTDAVIYTRGFVERFQNADFQNKLYKAASTYMLKTWRIDEDKSIQIISMSNALVKELNEKRQAIHPDFVKDGIMKMRELEKKTLERMKATLGSEVRVDSYRRFEKKFYEQQQLSQ